jgi:hypothetical protein
MKYTVNMPVGATAHDVVNWILRYADNSREMRLENVIINCHGHPGKLYVGGSYGPEINIGNVTLFTLLKDTDIGEIWLVSCGVAATTKGPTVVDGKAFCSAMARAADCDVIASDTDQYVEAGYEIRGALSGGWVWGCIDDFEGTAYRFFPSGGYVWFSHKGRRFKS